MGDPIPSKAGVYRIYRIDTGDEYVGSSVNLARRWKYHVNRLGRGLHHARHLQHAWKKYGADAFTFEVLELVEDMTVLLEREDFHLQVRRPVYNQRRTASSNLGMRYSEDSCALIQQRVSETWTGNEARREQARLRALAQWSDPEMRAKAIVGMKGRVLTEEQRAHLRAVNLGKRASEDTRAKMRAQRAGVPQGPHSAETRKRIGDAQRGKKRGPRSAEACANLSAALKGKPKSPEHIAKMLASRAANRERTRLQATPLVQAAFPLTDE